MDVNDMFDEFVNLFYENKQSTCIIIIDDAMVDRCGKPYMCYFRNTMKAETLKPHHLFYWIRTVKWDNPERLIENRTEIEELLMNVLKLESIPEMLDQIEENE